MNKFIKYLKSLAYIFVPILIINIIISILYYFNIISDNLNNYLKLFGILISMLIGGMYIGTKSEKKGWLEGIKIGLIIIFLFFLISYLGFDSFEIKYLVYYFMLIISSTLGSMIGINKRKSK